MERERNTGRPAALRSAWLRRRRRCERRGSATAAVDVSLEELAEFEVGREIQAETDTRGLRDRSRIWWSGAIEKGDGESVVVF